MTCDGWQASNVDGYFAVTGHWIERVGPLHWELRHALLGFVRMNNSHTGKNLGHALYLVLDRLNIVEKVRGAMLYSTACCLALNLFRRRVGLHATMRLIMAQ